MDNSYELLGIPWVINGEILWNLLENWWEIGRGCARWRVSSVLEGGGEGGRMEGGEKNNSGINIKTRMDFNRSWGLGTSAILINNLSNYFGLDPFEVSKNVTNSSGADIASTKISKPIIFSNNKKKTILQRSSF